MKKVFILMTILSVVFIGVLPAQGLGYGVKAGLNLANLTGDDVEDSKIKLGAAIGGFAIIPLGDKLSVRPEVLFTQKGAKYKESEDGVDYTGKSKMNWLDIPILAVYQVADAISAFVGPYFDLYLGGERTFKIEGDGVSFEGDEKIEGDDINSLGFGLIFGGAYGVAENIDVEARIALGLTSLHEEETVKNFGIQVNANYYLKK